MEIFIYALTTFFCGVVIGFIRKDRAKRNYESINRDVYHD